MHGETVKFIDYYSLLTIGIIYSLITAARYCTALSSDFSWFVEYTKH